MTSRIFVPYDPTVPHDPLELVVRDCIAQIESISKPGGPPIGFVIDTLHRILVEALIGEPATGGKAREQELVETDDIKLVRHDRDRFRDECVRAYETIAEMYAAATGRHGEPPASSDLVADVTAVRDRLLELEKANERLTRSLNTVSTVEPAVAAAPAPTEWRFEIFDRSLTRQRPDQPLARLSATGDLQLNTAAAQALARYATSRTGQESASYVEIAFDQRRGGLSLIPCVSFSPDRSFAVLPTVVVVPAVFNPRSAVRGQWPVKIDVREALNWWRIGSKIPPWQELPVVLDGERPIVDLTGCRGLASTNG